MPWAECPTSCCVVLHRVSSRATATCILQALQLGDEAPDMSTVLINLAGTVLFAALFVADQRAAGARVERRTQAGPRSLVPWSQ